MLFNPELTVCFVGGLNDCVSLDLFSWLVQCQGGELLVADLLNHSLVHKFAWANLGLVAHVLVADDIDVLELFVKDVLDFDAACHVSLQLLHRASQAEGVLKACDV